MNSINLRVIFIGLFAILVLGVGGFYLWNKLGARTVPPLSSVAYTCDAGKTIQADFYEKSVKIVLSDGREFSLPQMVSSVGDRYTNAEKSIVFERDGDTAHVGEGSSEIPTYSNCTAAGSEAASMGTYTSTAASSTPGFTVKYPKTFSLNSAYVNETFPKKPISGIKLTVPETMATGTNLSSDTGLSVEWLPNARNCTGDIFVAENVKAQKVTENGVSYSVATTSGAGAGNLYEETVYAISGSKPCTAVRYFVHSGNIGNYPAGTVTEFDRAGLMAQFDKIRQSLTLSN
ncbi:MAG TPA: MliC family protein [Candidatus Paceibacterota bacterium]|nr:MliC family protein [Candidatus Paceibacterota bacterium]